MDRINRINKIHKSKSSIGFFFDLIL